MTCGGSFPSDRRACLPAAATASSTASRGTNAASTPSDTQSVSRPPAVTTPLSAISRDHAGHQAQHHAATRPGTKDQLGLMHWVKSRPAGPYLPVALTAETTADGISRGI